MWAVTKSFKVKLGGNTYIDCGSLIDFRHTPLFTLKRRDEDGLLGIDFDIYDAAGKKVATVRRGTIVHGNAADYEFTHGAHHYVVKEKKTGRTICDIKRAGNAVDSELAVSVDMYTPTGFHLVASQGKTNIGGITMSGCTMAGCGVGVSVN